MQKITILKDSNTLFMQCIIYGGWISRIRPNCKYSCINSVFLLVLRILAWIFSLDLEVFVEQCSLSSDSPKRCSIFDDTINPSLFLYVCMHKINFTFLLISNAYFMLILSQFLICQNFVMFALSCHLSLSYKM